MRHGWAAVAAGVALLAAGTSASAQSLGPDAEACQAGNVPAVLARISGLKDRKGRLMLELYPGDDADYLRDDRDLEREGKVFRRVTVPAPATGAVAICIRVPRPGRYGLFLQHDRDGQNKFNYLVDGAAVPSNKAIGMSKPKPRNGMIQVGNGTTVVNLVAQYLVGFGFGPL